MRGKSERAVIESARGGYGDVAGSAEPFSAGHSSRRVCERRKMRVRVSVSSVRVKVVGKYSFCNAGADELEW